MARRAIVPQAQPAAAAAADVAALAREHTAAAVAALVKLLTDDDKKLQAAAATALLDRGWGRPGQPSEAAARPFAQLSDEEVTQSIALLRDAMARAKRVRPRRKP